MGRAIDLQSIGRGIVALRLHQIILKCPTGFEFYAIVSQLVEGLICNQDVVSSSLTDSSIFYKYLKKGVIALNLHKLNSENEEQYVWRLGLAKDSGELDMSWDELANIINKELGNEDRPLSEAAFRKPFQYAKKYFEAGVFNNLNEDKYLKELQLRTHELTKEQIKVRDERNELNRIIREEARKAFKMYCK